MLYIIILVAVVAFLIVLCVIYFDNIKNKLKNIFKKPQKKESQKKEEKKPQVNVDDFIPLRNQYSEEERDESLQSLFSAPELNDENNTLVNDDGKKLYMDDIVDNKNIEKTTEPLAPSENMDFDKMFADQFDLKGKNNKTVAQQIQELSPELKAILIDSLLKKRDDV